MTQVTPKAHSLVNPPCPKDDLVALVNLMIYCLEGRFGCGMVLKFDANSTEFKLGMAHYCTEIHRFMAYVSSLPPRKPS